jgi:hypothetical protein
MATAADWHKLSRKADETAQQWSVRLVEKGNILEEEAQMLSTTPFASLPAKYQRWRAVLQNFESITIKYVGFKDVAMADHAPLRHSQRPSRTAHTAHQRAVDRAPSYRAWKAPVDVHDRGKARCETAGLHVERRVVSCARRRREASGS